MRAALLSSVLLLRAVASPAAIAQGGSPSRIPAAIGEIVGRVVAADDKHPLTSGSVAVRRGTEAAFASGALLKADGSFVVDGLVPGPYTVRVRAMGYQPLLKTNVVITAASPRVDLGTMPLARVVVQLSEQTVTAEREDVALAPDRNSYSTKNMTTASGGTAIDVLRNIPSVEVDAQNQVSLRGNQNVVVQINGRSSPLKGEQLGTFLAQLPASAVKNVEVATNPSAKNDPEGTAGIINIVLNQEADLGLSGGINASAGSLGQASLSGNVGGQRGRFIAVVSPYFYRDQRSTDGGSSRTNLLVPAPVFVDLSRDGRFSQRSGGGTLRTEYRLDERDALTFDAYAFVGRFAGGDAGAITNLDGSRTIIGAFDTFTDRLSHNHSTDFTAAFRRTGGPSKTTFSSELRFSDNQNASDVALWGAVVQPDPSIVASMIAREQDHSASHFPSWNWQTDYTRPFTQATKLEAGFKGTQRHTMNDFTAAYYDSTAAAYVPSPARANAFDYRESIGAGYAVLSQRVGKAQLQGGLRLEGASTRLALPTLDSAYDAHYGSAFPSAIASYNFTDMRQAKISYSRRISRPNPFQLSPIEYHTDSRSVFRGNPNLRPEYTDAFELTLQDAHGWGSVQVNPYLRRTNNAVRYIQLVDTTGVTLGTFDNVARTTTTGADLNVSLHPGPMTIFTGGSVYRYWSDASNLTGNLSTRAVNWSVRANATWKISPLTDVQFFGNYRAPVATEGGRQGAFAFMNVAARYKAWGDQGSVSLRLTDPFDVMRWDYVSTSPQAIEHTTSHFHQRALYVTVSRNFGQQLKLRPRQTEQDPQAAPVSGPTGNP